MPKASDNRARARLERLRTLAEHAPPAVTEKYRRLLAGSLTAPGQLRYLLISDRVGQQEWLLAESIAELTVLAHDGLQTRPRRDPIEIVDLDTGVRRPAVLTAFFTATETVLLSLVGDILAADVADRESDRERNPKRDDELRRACEFIRKGDPVPAALFPAVADVIELDLEDRGHDIHRNPDVEQLLRDLYDQLLLRTPIPE